MTTSLSDAQQIDNLLSDTTLDSVKYNDAQWAYLTDINSSSYQDRIIFSTTVLKQQLIDYHSAFITIPISVQRAQLPLASGTSTAASAVFNDFPSAAPQTTSMVIPTDYVNTQVGITVADACDPSTQTNYLKGPSANETLLCFRDSILNLICGLIVQTDNGQAIINELGRLDFINNLRLKIENSIDWTQTMGSLLHFSMDTVPSSVYAGGTVASTTSTQINPRNNSVNPFAPDILTPGVSYSSAIDAAGQRLQGSTLNPATISAFSAPTTGNTITITAGAATANAATFSSTANASAGGIVFIPSTGVYYRVTANTTNVAATVVDAAGASPTVSAGTAFVFYAPTATSAFPPIAVPNPGFNKGVWDRCQIFQNSTVYRAGTGGSRVGTYDLIAKIPLRLLHDFFEQIDFPIINMGFNFQFILRQNNSSNTPGSSVSQSVTCYQNCPPLMGAALWGSADRPYATFTAGLPSITYGSSLPSVNSGSYQMYGTGCRLYYRSIKLNPSENEQFKSKLMRGFTKKIKFISTDYFQNNQTVSSSINSIISPSIVWPLRVWVLLYTSCGIDISNSTTGALGGNFSNAVPGGGDTSGRGQAAQCGLQVVHGWLKNANILVNNQPYFKNNLQTVDDFWLQLKEQFNRNTGSMLTYQDFCRNFRYHCFDLSRLSDRLPSKTEAVTLQLTADRADNTGGKCDLVVMIERMNQVQFDFSASDVAVTVGNITA